MDNNKIVAEYLNSSIEDMEMSIGRIVVLNDNKNETLMYPAEINASDAKEACSRYIENIYKQLKKKICYDFGLSSFKYQEKLEDNIQIVLAVAVLIEDLSAAVPPLMLASLLVKKGLNNLCEENKCLK